MGEPLGVTWFANQLVAPELSPNHRIARSSEELAHMVRCVQQAPDRAFDFEGDGLRYANGKKVIGYGVGYMGSDGNPYSWYVPVAHRTAEPMADPTHARAAFRDALSGARALIGHHLKYDLNMGRADGWEIPEDAQIHDTLVQAYLTYEKRAFGLEAVVAATPAINAGDPFQAKKRIEDYTRERAKLRKMTWKKDKPGEYRESYLSRYGHSEIPVPLEGEYCCLDIDHTLLLDRAQRREAMGIGTPWELQRRYLYDNEMLLVRAIADMEYTGQLIDADYLRRYAAELDEELDQRGRQLVAMFGASINFANDNQVRELLYKYLKLPVLKYTDTGAAAVDRGALLLLRQYHPGIEHLADYALRVKVRSTYTHSLAFRQDKDGRVHASFLQQGTKTGRLSGKDPNLQNIPNREKELATAIRRGFLIEDGMARVYSDYSQIELRVLGWVVESRNFHAAYHSPAYMQLLKGEIDYETYRRLRAAEPEVDAHGDQARAVFGANPSDPDWKKKRGGAKILNFGTCIAEGQRVLTKQDGLVPIERVQDWHLVWDGVEWVSHDGLVCRGAQTVITYDGLTATPDHQVYLDNGTRVPIGQLASEVSGRRIATGAVGETPVGYTAFDRRGGDPWPFETLRGSRLHGMRKAKVGAGGQRSWREVTELHLPTWEVPRPSIQDVGSAVRCDGSALREGYSRVVASVQRAWDQGLVQFPGRVHPLGPGEMARLDVQGSGLRSDRQRRTLLEDESSPCRSINESTQSVRVYDLLNAGPRHRFTVEGKIVSNSYGMSYMGLMSNPQLLLGKAEAEEFFAKFHQANPEIRVAQQRLFRKMIANGGRDEPFFINWAGRKVHAPELRAGEKWRRRSAERSAFASLVQGSAGELTRFSLVALWKAMKEGRLPARATSTVHDEIQLDCRQEDLPYVARETQRIMEDTFRGRFGTIPVVADLEVSTTNWAEKEDYPLCY